MTNYIDPKRIAHLMWKPGENEAVEPPKEENRQERTEIAGNYILMPKTSTYAQGVQALRSSYEKGECPAQPLFVKPDGSNVVRPLTFRENLRARIEDYNRLENSDGSQRNMEDRLKLLTERWLDSCTGVAYQSGTDKMKIILVCNELIEIPSGFNDPFFPVNYANIEGFELDRSEAKYGELLTKDQVLNHPAWQAAVEDDKNLLKEYCDIVFSQLMEKYSRDNGMRFWVRSTTENDELRALFVSILNNNSYAYGISNLGNNGSFLRVAP